MPTSKITSRGQTTIPKPIREALGLEPGDRVEFTARGDHVVLTRSGADLTELDGMLADESREPVSLQAMDAAVREGARSRASTSSE